ncbi:hypothetical protein QBC45DRAFT_102090 [Copromyces sp. CBS 386.78]|nr:hypothetical protein QBC45DRAFT_102090 [Copromyces sp. CBS 386.78]
MNMMHENALDRWAVLANSKFLAAFTHSIASSSWQSHDSHLHFPARPGSTEEAMDYATDPVFLLLITPHVLWIGSFYYYHMHRQSNGRLDSSPPVVPEQDDKIDTILSKLIFLHMGWRWVEAAERARLGLIHRLIATCL